MSTYLVARAYDNTESCRRDAITLGGRLPVAGNRVECLTCALLQYPYAVPSPQLKVLQGAQAVGPSWAAMRVEAVGAPLLPQEAVQQPNTFLLFNVSDRRLPAMYVLTGALA